MFRCINFSDRLGTTKHLVLALGLAYCLFVAIDGIYVKLVVRLRTTQFVIFLNDIFFHRFFKFNSVLCFQFPVTFRVTLGATFGIH